MKVLPGPSNALRYRSRYTLHTGCALRLRQVSCCLPSLVCSTGSSVASMEQWTPRSDRVSSAPVCGSHQASGALGTEPAADSPPTIGVSAQLAVGGAGGRKRVG